MSLGYKEYIYLYILQASSAVLSSASSEAFASRLFRDESPLGTVVVPQSAQHLAGHHLAHVHADQPDDEHAVAAQVVLGELGEDARLALRRVEGAQLLADVLDLAGPVERAEQPLEEVDDADERQADVPEPDEEEDLLVEEVDRQRALDDVVVQARLAPDRKLAERDAREPLRLRPVLAAQQALDDVGAVQVVVVDEQRVEEEQLADGVDDVDGLDRQVGGDQVVAVQLATDDAADLGDEVLDAHETAGSIVALREQVAVHLVDDVADRLLADLEVRRLGADDGWRGNTERTRMTTE